MKKKVFGRKLSRDRGARLALFRSIIKALINNGEIRVTYAKAKAVQPTIEKLVTLAKERSLSARRRLLAFLANDRKTTDILFTKIADAFSERKSGFTKMVRLPARRGDASELVRLKWSQKIELGEKSAAKKMKKEVKKTSAGLKSKILQKAKIMKGNRKDKK